MRTHSIAMAAVILFLLTCQAPSAEPPGKHVYDRDPLARCSSGFKREVIDDSKARDGKAVRYTVEGYFISLHDEVRVTPGRHRFTVRLRLEGGGHMATDLEVGGKDFQNRTPLEFSDLPADGSYAERTVEMNLPNDLLRVVSLRGGLPKSGLVVDRIEVERVPGAATVEVASAAAGKLVYAPRHGGAQS